jgi:uncharacterized membrane protein YdjX (TVP38/TMEM64 family)
MKYIIRIILATIIGLIGYGYYLKNANTAEGDKWIGIGVLLIAFVLMPLFIYHRYKNKNVKDYLMSNFTQEKEKTENQ